MEDGRGKVYVLMYLNSKARLGWFLGEKGTQSLMVRNGKREKRGKVESSWNVTCWEGMSNLSLSLSALIARPCTILAFWMNLSLFFFSLWVSVTSTFALSLLLLMRELLCQTTYNMFYVVRGAMIFTKTRLMLPTSSPTVARDANR